MGRIFNDKLGLGAERQGKCRENGEENFRFQISNFRSETQTPARVMMRWGSLSRLPAKHRLESLCHSN
jgi:hypothetical protein